MDPCGVLLQSALPRDLLSAATHAAGVYLGGSASPDADEGDALCSSHWLPLREQPPDARHALEAAVLAVATAVCRARQEPLWTCGGKPLTGLEWWLQEQDDQDEPKEYHTDKAAQLVGDEVHVQNPLLSTVLYLSDTGGPTVVFEQRAAPRGGGLDPEVPCKLSVAFPSPGRLLVFNGSLVHGVLRPPRGDFAPTAERPRRTLLVNLWAERPPGASELPLSVELPRAPSRELAEGAPDLASTVCLSSQESFLAQAKWLKKQEMPPEVLACCVGAGADVPALVTVRYAAAGEPVSAPARDPDLVWSWWE